MQDRVVELARAAQASRSRRPPHAGRRSRPALAPGPEMVIVATPFGGRSALRRGIARRSRPRRRPAPAASARCPCAAVFPGAFAAKLCARAATVSSNFELGTTSSTRRHSCARLPFTPSSMEQNTSARSRRTLRLSVTRVRPPVPGSTASSGTSGSATEDAPSSVRMMWSQASASS